jgi:hypothetical protein
MPKNKHQLRDSNPARPQHDVNTLCGSEDWTHSAISAGVRVLCQHPPTQTRSDPHPSLFYKTLQKYPMGVFSSTQIHAGKVLILWAW